MSLGRALYVPYALPPSQLGPEQHQKMVPVGVMFDIEVPLVLADKVLEMVSWQQRDQPET